MQKIVEMLFGELKNPGATTTTNVFYIEWSFK